MAALFVFLLAIGLRFIFALPAGVFLMWLTSFLNDIVPYIPPLGFGDAYVASLLFTAFMSFVVLPVNLNSSN